MKARYLATCEKLRSSGWIYDHEALCNNYRYSGEVSDMATRKGNYFCRVHVGKSYRGNNGYQYQLTIVYRKPITK